VSALKENSKQTMDSIYTTKKDVWWNNLSWSKTVYLEGGTNIIVDGSQKWIQNNKH
jgi:hypothetical protein